MKTKNIAFVVFALVVSWMIDLQFNAGYSNESGAPAAVTGSPGDGNKTCAKSGSHTGNAVVSTPNLITSNIPATGYVPGTTYTITSTCTQTGINRWGFEISPQSLTGNLIGQLIITNTSQTKIKSTKYVTQTTSGSAGSGTKTWSFDWVAPVAGTGDVTFYGSFNYANNNGSTGGDHIHTSTLVVSENTGTTGLIAVSSGNNKLEVWPNPVTESFSVRLNFSKPCNAKIALMSMDRKTVHVLSEENVAVGTYTRLFQLNEKLPAGIYLVTVATGEQVLVKKITVL